MANMQVDSWCSPGFTRVHGLHVCLDKSSDAGTVWETYCPSPGTPLHFTGHRCKVLGGDTGESGGDTTWNSTWEWYIAQQQWGNSTLKHRSGGSGLKCHKKEGFTVYSSDAARRHTCPRRWHTHKGANINQPQAGEINRITKEQLTVCSRSLEQSSKHKRSRRYTANTVKHTWLSTAVDISNTVRLKTPPVGHQRYLGPQA